MHYLIALQPPTSLYSTRFKANPEYSSIDSKMRMLAVTVPFRIYHFIILTAYEMIQNT